MRILEKTNINFLGARKITMMVSAALVLISAISLIARGGPRFGIDFTGGTLVQVRFDNPYNLPDIRRILSDHGLQDPELQTLPEVNGLIVRMKKGQRALQEIGDQVLSALEASITDNPITLERVEYVGPAVGKYLTRQASWAILGALAGIVVYVGFRFKSMLWGAAGVLALAHDVFITVGLFSFLNREIDLTVIAALLTLAGYSINDTIVIFDRVREKLRYRRKEPLDVIFNASLNETLSRTAITSLTTLLTVFALFLLGGEIIHDFALALLFGIFIGTYSTLGLATPLVYNWMNRNPRRAQGG